MTNACVDYMLKTKREQERNASKEESEDIIQFVQVAWSIGGLKSVIRSDMVYSWVTTQIP